MHIAHLSGQFFKHPHAALAEHEYKCWPQSAHGVQSFYFAQPFPRKVAGSF